MLGGIDFEVEPSQVVVVIVPSGSGKSTLLRCCNSLEVPESGSVKICGRMLINNGQPLPEAELDLLRRDVGMVFQSFNADRLIEFLGALGHRCAVEEERWRKQRAEESVSDPRQYPGIYRAVGEQFGCSVRKFGYSK